MRGQRGEEGGNVPGLQQLIESAQEWERMASGSSGPAGREGMETGGPGMRLVGGGIPSAPAAGKAGSSEDGSGAGGGRKRRRHCSTACVQCAKSKSACDDQRPCARCIRQHNGVCEDRPWSARHPRTDAQEGDGSQDAAGRGGAGLAAGENGHRKKRRQIAKGMACLACTRSKTGCDGGRPCGRCLRVNKGMCVDKPRSGGSAASEQDADDAPAAAAPHPSAAPAAPKPPAIAPPPQPAPLAEDMGRTPSSAHRPNPNLNLVMPPPAQRVESSASTASFMSRVPSNCWSLPSRCSSTDTTAVFSDFMGRASSSLSSSQFNRLGSSAFGRLDSTFDRSPSVNFNRVESGFNRTESAFGRALDSTDELMMGLNFGRIASIPPKPPQAPSQPNSGGTMAAPQSPGMFVLPKHHQQAAHVGSQFEICKTTSVDFPAPSIDVFVDPSDRNSANRPLSSMQPEAPGMAMQQPMSLGGMQIQQALLGGQQAQQQPGGVQLPPMMTPQLSNLEALAGAIAQAQAAWQNPYNNVVGR